MKGGLVIYAVLIGIIMLALIFTPMIFGNMEGNINLTNNTTAANYNTTATVIQISEYLLWVGAIIIGIFMLVAGLLYFRGGRR